MWEHKAVCHSLLNLLAASHSEELSQRSSNKGVAVTYTGFHCVGHSALASRRPFEVYTLGLGSTEVPPKEKGKCQCAQTEEGSGEVDRICPNVAV